MHGVRRRARILRYVRFPKESMIPVVVRYARLPKENMIPVVLRYARLPKESIDSEIVARGNVLDKAGV